MAAPTIQDVEKSAADLGTAIASFDTADQSAKASRAQADAADAAAVGQEAASATAKQSLIDSHEAFDTVLTAFLATLPH